MGLYDVYKYIIYDLADPRAKNDVILGTPWTLIAIIITYYYFVTNIGPKWMKKREAFKIDWLIKIYNGLQIIWNIYMFSYTFKIAAAGKELDNFSVWCIPLMVTDETALGRANFSGIWHYMYNKVVDLLDTIFFVLRKKNKQITYTHVYHHIIMCFSTWTFSRYGAGGNPTSVGLLNSLIHVFMYSYYLLSIMGLGSWLWWKKYLTLMQILQFAVLFTHNISVFFWNDCQYNVYLSFFAAAQSLYFLYLFTNFYIHTYLKDNKKKN